MKKIFVMLAVMLSSTAYASPGSIQYCNNCRVYYQKKVVRPAPVYAVPSVPVAVPAVPVPVPVPAVPVVRVPVPEVPLPVQPVAPGYVANPMGQVYAAPYDQQPIAITPSGRCATYVDPYDLFGELFGNPDLVQSCW